MSDDKFNFSDELGLDDELMALLFGDEKNDDWQSIFNSPEQELAQCPDEFQGSALPISTANQKPADSELPRSILPEKPVRNAKAKSTPHNTVPKKQQAESKSKQLLLFGCATALVLLLIVGIGVFSLIRASDPYHNRILKNVSISGVEVGGMTEREAIKALKAEFDTGYQSQNIVIHFTDTDLTLNHEQTKAQIRFDEAAKAAFNLGREETSAEQFASFDAAENGGIQMSLAPFIALDENTIRSIALDLVPSSSVPFAGSSHYVEGDTPDLNEAHFDSNAVGQILVLNTGTPGSGLNADKLLSDIRDAYSTKNYQLNQDCAVGDNMPESLDLQAIYDSLYIAPVEPVLNRTDMTITPGSYGVAFDLNSAKEQVNAAGYSEILRIPLEYVAPKLHGDEIYFQDVLGFCATPHGNNEKRNTNLQIACAALNGVVIQPGETFSYSKTIKPRTAENGYQPAPAYSGTNLVDSIGGGVCQVSSTLYLASLYAELEIVERVNHGYPANYMPAGLDATVSGDSPDMVIKNNYDLPIKLLAEDDGTYVKVWILGIDNRDHYVRMQFSAGASYARTTKNLYNRDTNALMSSEPDRVSGYMSASLSAFGEIGPYDVYVNGNVKPLDPEVYMLPQS